jgi:hypothetical protein
VAQRVDGGMQFGPFLPFMAVVASAAAAFGRALQGFAVQDRRARLPSAARVQTQECAQVVDDGFEDPGIEPAARLLLRPRPSGEVVRQPLQHAPLRAGPHQSSARPLEDFPQIVTPLRRVFAHQGQIRRGRCDHSSSLTSLG